MPESSPPTAPAPSAVPADREAFHHQRAEELALLKTVRMKLRRRFKLCAYSAFGLWLVGIMLTIFSKGITRPWETQSVGTPYGLGLVGLGVVLALVAWRIKVRLNHLIQATRERTAEFKGT